MPPAPERPCAVRDCIEPGEDRHHWSPGSLFGSGRERWPTSLLCKHHHRTWHVVMDGYRWAGMVYLNDPSLYRRPEGWPVAGPDGARIGWGTAVTEIEAQVWGGRLSRAYQLGRVDEAEVLLTGG